MNLEEKTIDYKGVLEKIYNKVVSEENIGAIATYIPELAKVDADNFGVCLLSVQNDEYGIGNWQTKFSIQSISKVLSLSIAYKIFGDDIWKRVDVEPSGTAFNSLVQLESDLGIPRNPFMNSGAMVICDMLVSYYKNPKEDFLAAVREICNSTKVNYSEAVADSEASVGYRNKALCNFIKSFGNIENEPEEVLDFYFHICSIEMSCQELSRVFMFLANPNFTTTKGSKVLSLTKSKRVNAIMQTCGFYDESGEFSFRVGLPGKSGVGGGIVAVYPEKYCITVWSPKLNEKGNSYRGMKFLEAFTTETEQSIF
jgi:glutaminase